jgi:hypothetical protein
VRRFGATAFVCLFVPAIITWGILGSGAFAAPAAGAGRATRQAPTLPPALACVQNALGGERTLAAVKTLRISGITTPLVSSGPSPLPGTREISVMFPDRYRREDIGRLPSGMVLGSTIGFHGPALLSDPRVPDDQAALRSAHQDFAREMLKRLPRPMPGITLEQRTITDDGQERIAIDASDASGLFATLLVHPDTCLPAALDAVFSRGPGYRVEMSGYREFNGVRFPTVLTTLRESAPFTEERVTDVAVNAPGVARDFD